MTIQDSPIRARKNVYTDIDLSFSAHPNSGDVTRKVDLNAVKQSVHNILMTSKGEKVFDPNFGCNLRAYLFDLFSPAIAAKIKAAIRYNLTNYEPRISLISVDVSEDSDNNSLRITVDYTIKSPDPTADTVSVVVERLR